MCAGRAYPAASSQFIRRIALRFRKLLLLVAYLPGATRYVLAAGVHLPIRSIMTLHGCWFCGVDVFGPSDSGWCCSNSAIVSLLHTTSRTSQLPGHRHASDTDKDAASRPSSRSAASWKGPRSYGGEGASVHYF